MLQSLQKAEVFLEEGLPLAGCDEMQLIREHMNVLVKFTWCVTFQAGCKVA